MTRAETRAFCARIQTIDYLPTQDEADSLARAYMKLMDDFRTLRSGVMDALDESMER